MRGRFRTHTGECSKQFTTAGADIDFWDDLYPLKPAANKGPENKKRPGTVIITFINAAQDDVVIWLNETGTVTDLWEVESVPFEIPVQCYGIDSTSTSGVKGNVVW